MSFNHRKKQNIWQQISIMSSLFQEFCVVTKLCMANYNVAMYVHYEAYVCAQLLFMEIMVIIKILSYLCYPIVCTDK